MPETPSTVRIAPVAGGCCIRVEGHGTMRESAAVADLVERTLAESETAAVVIDLERCDYLDSTFLGSLITLSRHHHAPRFGVSAPAALRKKLFGPCGLEKIIPASTLAPPAAAEWVCLSIEDDEDAAHRMRHVLDCHRALAEIDSPLKKVFTHIADQIEKDLSTRSPA